MTYAPGPKKLLHIVYPELPPSSNKIYFQGTRLTKQAREYAERFSEYVTQRYLPQISQMDPEAAYAVHLRFFLESCINPTYNDPNLPPSRRAKTWYKRVDVTNRIKLLEDCIRDALAIDDCHSFATSQEKHHCPDNPHVEIFVQEVDPELFGLPRRPPMP